MKRVVAAAEAVITLQVGDHFRLLTVKHPTEYAIIPAHSMEAQEAEEGAGIIFGHGDDSLRQFDKRGALVRIELGDEAFTSFI